MTTWSVLALYTLVEACVVSVSVALRSAHVQADHVAAAERSGQRRHTEGASAAGASERGAPRGQTRRAVLKRGSQGGEVGARFERQHAALRVSRAAGRQN